MEIATDEFFKTNIGKYIFDLHKMTKKYYSDSIEEYLPIVIEVNAKDWIQKFIKPIKISLLLFNSNSELKLKELGVKTESKKKGRKNKEKYD